MKKAFFLLSFLFIFTFLMGDVMNLEHADVNYWNKDSYFVQKNVKVFDNDQISAKIDGKWQNYTLKQLPDKFIDWSVKRRIATIEDIKKGKMPELAGPHNGMVASYGIARNDSRFKINNAVKGIGYCPRADKIDYLIKLLNETKDSGFDVKLKTLVDLYKNVDKYYDRKRLLSLELYSTKDFETGTFLNEMAYPNVSIVFLDIPCFEVKAVPELLHPKNPNLSDYQKSIVEYTNLIHSYFHGKFSRMFIAVVYNVIEVYDNSPEPKARGRRIVPSLP
ncbi:MAG: hypothetical protein GWP03_01060 [Proteobacteria bacterium]|nr:hypothetical protein [Pseudomonadota bacterium]